MYSFPGAPIAKGHKRALIATKIYSLSLGGYRPESQVSAGQAASGACEEVCPGLTPSPWWRLVALGWGREHHSHLCHCLHDDGGSPTGCPTLLQHVIVGDIREDPVSDEATCRGAGGLGFGIFLVNVSFEELRFNPSQVF